MKGEEEVMDVCAAFVVIFSKENNGSKWSVCYSACVGTEKPDRTELW